MKTNKPKPEVEQASVPPVVQTSEQVAPAVPSELLEKQKKQNVHFTIAVGVIILGITFLMLVIDSMPWGAEDQLPQNTEVNTPAVSKAPAEDWSRLPDTNETAARFQQLYGSTEQRAASTGVFDPRPEDLKITAWESPRAASDLKVGEIYNATGNYRVPADYLARISVFRDGVLLGAQVVDNRGKEAAEGPFSIKLPPYQAGPHTYTIEYDGVASCRLVCALGDTSCMMKDSSYCAASHTNQRFTNYKPEVIGITDRYSTKTCLMQEFTSGPMNQGSPDSCATEGFKTPFHIEAQAFVSRFNLDEATKQQFIQDLATYYSAVTSGNGEKSIQRDLGEASWSFDYKQSSENQNGMCMGTTVVKVHCPKE